MFRRLASDDPAEERRKAILTRASAHKMSLNDLELQIRLCMGISLGVFVNQKLVYIPSQLTPEKYVLILLRYNDF